MEELKWEDISDGWLVDARGYVESTYKYMLANECRIVERFIEKFNQSLHNNSGRVTVSNRDLRDFKELIWYLIAENDMRKTTEIKEIEKDCKSQLEQIEKIKKKSQSAWEEWKSKQLYITAKIREMERELDWYKKTYGEIVAGGTNAHK